MSRSLKELIFIQFKGYWREPEVLFWTLGFPIMVASVLGLLYSYKPAVKYKAALVVQEEAFKKSILGTLSEIEIPGESKRKIVFNQVAMDQAENLYMHGKVDLIVELKSNNEVNYLFDPANERTETIYLWIHNRLEKKGSSIKSSVQKLDQPGNRYIDYLIPGLIAMGIMNATLWGVGWTLIEFRIKKFLRRMIATPMKKVEFMLSVSITRLTLSMIEAGILYLFARYAFNVQMRGGFLTFGLMFLAGHIAFSGLSILLASRTNNTRVGNGLINVITMPMFLLSGVFFSYHSFPEWLVNIIKFIPLTVLADSMREIFLFGSDIFSHSFALIYLIMFGLITYIAGLKIYKWY